MTRVLLSADVLEENEGTALVRVDTGFGAPEMRVVRDRIESTARLTAELEAERRESDGLRRLLERSRMETDKAQSRLRTLERAVEAKDVLLSDILAWWRKHEFDTQGESGEWNTYNDTDRDLFERIAAAPEEPAK